MVDRNILIYGAGGAGRELAFTLSLEKSGNRSWKLQGFIDDKDELLGKSINGAPVLGGYEYLDNFSGNIAVTIFGKPDFRKMLILKLKKNKKIIFPNIVAQESLVSHSAKLGEGCIVKDYSIISVNTRIGDFVFVGTRSGIGHDAIIGDFTSIFSGINIGGGVSVGSCCLIGSGATLLPGVKIGDGSIIGGGALVSNDMPPGVVAAGVPAKIIREIIL